ncbi:MAG: hypothetical protein ABI705_08115 [Aestuariivirga sp.]
MVDISITTVTCPKLIIDRLSVCYFEPNQEEVGGTINLLISEKTHKTFPGLYVTSSRFYKVSSRLPLVDPTTQKMASICFEAGPRIPGHASFRIDFNPSKLTSNMWSQLWTFLQLIVDADSTEFFQLGRVTRLDVAIDLPGLTLEQVIVRSRRARKMGVYSDQHGNPETVYLGTPKSRRVVAYNKQDANLSSHFLRLEVRLKPNFMGKDIIYIPNPFKNVDMFLQCAMPAQLIGIPSRALADSIRTSGLRIVKGYLNKDQRKLLVKAMKEAQSLLPSTEDIWKLWGHALSDSILIGGFSGMQIEKAA